MKIIAKIGTHSSQQIRVKDKRKIKIGGKIQFKRLEDTFWVDGIVSKICDWGINIDCL